MRIGHISTHRPLDVRIFHKECRTLATQGYEVHLVVPNAPAGSIDGVHFHSVEPATGPRLARIYRRLKRAYTAAAALNADIYHLHEPDHILVGVALKLRGAKVVYDVHEDFPKEALTLNKGHPIRGWMNRLAWIALEHVAMQFLDAFICATPTIGEKFPSARTTTVLNFPRLEEFACPTDGDSLSSRPNRIIYGGGITRVRGICEIVQAMEILPDSLDAKLALMGEFAPHALMTEVARMQGWEHVEYLGWQPRTAVVQQLAQARLGLVIFHPTVDHLEAIPNKLFEYMAAGIPVVASDFPLWREIIDGCRCGILVDPLNPRAIADAIQYLLERPEEADAMGQRGRGAVLTRYNWNTESEKLLASYQRLGDK
jgi:glycosyltransferase involved in cell wall biosynthesis